MRFYDNNNTLSIYSEEELIERPYIYYLKGSIADYKDD